MKNTYDRVSMDSMRLTEKNDCAVKAVAILTGKPYEDVHWEFRKAGRKRGRGTPPSITHAVLSEMGYELRPMKRLPVSVNRCEGQLAKSGRYLIHTSRHVLAYVNGRVHDWTAGRRHRPKNIYRVVRKRKARA